MLLMSSWSVHFLTTLCRLHFLIFPRVVCQLRILKLKQFSMGLAWVLTTRLWCASYSGVIFPYLTFKAIFCLCVHVANSPLGCTTVISKVASKEYMSSFSEWAEGSEWAFQKQQAARNREGEGFPKILQSGKDERSKFKLLDSESQNFRLRKARRNLLFYRWGNIGPENETDWPVPGWGGDIHQVFWFQV